VRKGFTLIEMLAVMVVLIIISFALAGVFTTVITDIPRSYRVIQTNTTLLNMLEQMRDDIGTATCACATCGEANTGAGRELPEAFSQYATKDGLLLIETSDGVISYQVNPPYVWRIKDDKVLRRNLMADACPERSRGDDSEVKDTRVWSVPHAKVKWQVWRENGKGYAVQVKTHIEHKVRGHWERKMANSHLYFMGVLQDALR